MIIIEFNPYCANCHYQLLLRGIFFLSLAAASGIIRRVRPPLD